MKPLNNSRWVGVSLKSLYIWFSLFKDNKDRNLYTFKLNILSYK